MSHAGFVRSSSRQVLDRDLALMELAKAGREVLIEVAASYRSSISYGQFAAETQRRAGIKASQPDEWLPEVLRIIVTVTHRLAEPVLTSLIVKADGQVGRPYDVVLDLQELPRRDADARELAAAASRLECYRRYAPHVPADAVPTLISAAAAARTPTIKSTLGRPVRGAGAAKPDAVRRPAAPKRRDPNENRAPHVLCPSCFIQTPPGLECQNCGASL